MDAKIFIAVPSYQNPDVDFTASYTGTVLNLYTGGMTAHPMFLHGNCYVHFCRDALAYHFLQTDCTHLFFWDNDVGAPVGALRNLIQHDRDIVVAPYPKKIDPASDEAPWPIRLGDGIPNARGLLKAETIATGFLLIKRHVMEALWKKHYKDRAFLYEKMSKPGAPAIAVDLFPTGLVDILPKAKIDHPDFPDGINMWWGEDVAFSLMARNAGFDIWLDPNIPLTHAGRYVWKGDFTKEADKA
jgi:hypothetical protein